MNNKTTPKDFFLHLLATIALYASAVAIINLSFSSINYAFPDALSNYFSPSSIVWPISMLIILVPTLYVLEWLIGKDLAKMSEKKDIWIRRWRIYLTLFLTGIAMLVDLITLINTYLNGEISVRFVCKVLVVLVVTGVIFVYYILDKSDDRQRYKSKKRLFGWLGIVLVLASIFAGFVIVGSPAKQRALRFDSQRASDLSNIQWQIVNYWQSKRTLPASLADLSDSIQGFKAPNDPQTRASYEYAVKNNPSLAESSMPAFELCASFSLPSEDASGRGQNDTNGGISYAPKAYPYSPDANDSWTHAAGRVCFERTIDPSKYPPLKSNNQ